MKKSILVTGSTGVLGKATLDFLLTKLPASQLVGLARDTTKAADLTAKGIEVRPGDYHDYPSLVEAFRGIQKVLLVSTVAFTDRTVQHLNAIQAAREAGVKHVFYTSIQRQNEVPYSVEWVTQSDIETERYLKNSGLVYTIVRNTFYADALPWLLSEAVLETGVAFPGNGRVPYTTRQDLAEALATMLTQVGHENQEYTLTGPETHSFSDIAGLLSSLAGKPVSYQDIPPELYIEQKIQAGFPQPVAVMWADWAEAMKRGLFNHTDPTLERVLGRKPTSLKEALRAAFFSNQSVNL